MNAIDDFVMAHSALPSDEIINLLRTAYPFDDDTTFAAAIRKANEAAIREAATWQVESDKAPLP